MILRRMFAGAGLVLCLTAISACSQEPTFMGRWTIERAEGAPWNDSGDAPDQGIKDAYVGKSVTFEEKRIDGPELLACANPKYEHVEVPAEGMFQGGLAESEVDVAKARERATTLGFKDPLVKTVRTQCEHDIAFHFTDADHAAFALDNWIFWLKRTP